MDETLSISKALTKKSSTTSSTPNKPRNEDVNEILFMTNDKLTKLFKKLPLERATPKSYFCKFCKAVGITKEFTVRQGLGGHTSRAHPKMSKSFQEKKDIRRKRMFEREILDEAKKRYRALYSTD
mmetsp:Transcript_10253/g.11689  ORF Transcript_10253/g.11689 Transcript_10253/m.11689 type:complete len:125 (+) Transcript_10253:650-1024(+)